MMAIGFLCAFSGSLSLAVAAYRAGQDMGWLGAIPAIAFSLFILLAGLLSWSGFALLLNRYFTLENRGGWKFAGFALLPFVLVLAAFLPVDFPQNWNHFLGKLRTCLSTAIFLSIQAAGWTFIYLGRKYGFRRPALTVFFFFFIVYSAFALTRLDRKMGGDEIGYYSMMRSIAEDGDINIANNMYPEIAATHRYLLPKDFTPDFSDPANLIAYADAFFHGGTAYWDSAGWHMFFPAMPMGPLLWALPYRAAGATGVRLFQMICCAGAIVLVFLTTRRAGTGTASAFSALFAVGVLPEWMNYSATFWLEPTSGALFAGSIFLLSSDSPRRRVWGTVLASLLPWVHLRFLIVPAAALGWLLFSPRTLRHEKTAGSVVVLIIMGTIPLFNLTHQQNIFPWGFRPPAETNRLEMQERVKAYERGQVEKEVRQSTTSRVRVSTFDANLKTPGGTVLYRVRVLLKNLLKVFLDTGTGLFVYFPLCVPALLAMVFCPPAGRALLLAYFGFIACYTASVEPNIRYFSPLLPWTALGLSAWFSCRPLPWSVAAAAALGPLLALYKVFFHERSCYGMLAGALPGLTPSPGIGWADLPFLLAWTAWFFWLAKRRPKVYI